MRVIVIAAFSLVKCKIIIRTFLMNFLDILLTYSKNIFYKLEAFIPVNYENHFDPLPLSRRR